MKLKGKRHIDELPKSKRCEDCGRRFKRDANRHYNAFLNRHYCDKCAAARREAGIARQKAKKEAKPARWDEAISYRQLCAGVANYWNNWREIEARLRQETEAAHPKAREIPDLWVIPKESEGEA
jgi:hypothetical protein